MNRKTNLFSGRYAKGGGLRSSGEICECSQNRVVLLSCHRLLGVEGRQCQGVELSIDALQMRSDSNAASCFTCRNSDAGSEGQR